MPVTQQQHWEYTVEEWNREEFKKLLDFPDVKVFYDIGANVGGVSYLVKQKFPNVKLYCFEPVKANYDFLKERLPDATCVKKGIFYGQTTSHIISRGDGNVGGVFLEHINTGFPRVDTGEVVELETLESFNFEKPDLIKMDVEGSEINIIEHSEIVKKCRNLIIEWHDENINYEDFFKKYLPNHGIKGKAGDSNYLLCLKSQ